MKVRIIKETGEIRDVILDNKVTFEEGSGDIWIDEKDGSLHKESELESINIESLEKNPYKIK